MNVFEFIEKHATRNSLPQVVTLKRTTASKYLYYLLVRHYKQELRVTPQFLTFSKSSSQAQKGLMEEIPLFGGGEFYALEGFPASMVRDLTLPKGVYVVAEVDDGELEAPAYSYKVRRGILRALQAQLGLKITLRDLVGLDWASVRDYPEMESLLRKAALAGWTAEDLSKDLSANTVGNILLLIKKGGFQDLLSIKSRYSDVWMFRHLTKLVPQLATYRSLVVMGQQPNAIAECLGVSNFKLREFEEAAKAVSMDDLRILGERILALDRIFSRNPGVATDLLLLKSGISMKR